MSVEELLPCPAGHVIQDLEDFVYPVDRSKKLWQCVCDQPHCSWSALGWTKQDAIMQWNSRNPTNTD